jgi:hypothetical protein
MAMKEPAGSNLTNIEFVLLDEKGGGSGSSVFPRFQSYYDFAVRATEVATGLSTKIGISEERQNDAEVASIRSTQSGSADSSLSGNQLPAHSSTV